MPITGSALLLALGSLAWRAHARHGYRPLMLGVGGAVGLLVGQFALAPAPITAIGALMLLIAAVWNAWPRQPGAPCSDCTPHHERKNHA
ncbi:MAG: hypothetical protein ABT19_02760 [Rhodanobacter sp. SCN 68-63]|nr:MAG: hypothetical protein ABT19_02760 [Rhodanobacter sp. SCN 68-63]